MTGVLDGLRVLDLSWGIAGPVTAMLLGDHGAAVTRIEHPDGDPFAGFPGYRVWHRGKRSAVLDLRDPADRDVFQALVSAADVLVESLSPAAAERLGVTHAELAALNPRLVHCSITGYGPDGPEAERPGYDALVAARTGQLWEHRGVTGGTIARLSGGEPMMAGVEPPDQECWVGAPRTGPLFSGVPWPSVATAYNATLGINAALRARERTGRGQHVHTSLLQGVLANTIGPWQRVERPDAPTFQSWVIDPRAPKGFWAGSDGRWLHHWVPLPAFILGTAAGPTGDWQASAPKDAVLRMGVDPSDMIILQHYDAELRDAVGSLPSTAWEAAAAEVGVPVQPVRSPEEALLDPALLADGCVVEVDDPELGPLRQVGSVVRLSACPADAPGPAPARGQHTAEVRAEAGTAAGAMNSPGPVIPPPDTGSGDPPLAGVRVLDLGLAVAGPFGTQLLADVGADVIKVNTRLDGYWFASHIAMCCNRGKRSIALDLKQPAAMDVLHELVAGADVVQHNMRYPAAVRLGIDYESLIRIKPDLVYCHTRGFEHGERDRLPGNDQTGAALAGTEWLDGGTDHGGRPLWSVCSAGDTGNGYLSAIGIVQALYHRDRTGEGQFVDTSILYAQLLNASFTWATPDGSRTADRPSLDAMQLGWSAVYGLYRTAEGWLCVAALTDRHWAALAGATDLGADPRFGSADDRRANDAELRAALEAMFARRSAEEWFKVLDAAGVPCETTSPDSVLRLFDRPDLHDRGWLTGYEHPVVGAMDVFGLLVDLSDTPGRVAGPPPLVGQHTRELLAELSYTPADIDALLTTEAAFDESSSPRP
jgi:crotonobetainyl-CoA:carnitine CoA-transferase CaiB-like acyl-CoA transferase